MRTLKWNQGLPELKITFYLLALLSFLECLRAQTPANESQRTDAIAMTVGARQIKVSELCTAIASLPPPQREGYTLRPKMAAEWFGPLVAMAEEAKHQHLEIQNNLKEGEVDIDNALVGELMQVIAHSSQPAKEEVEDYYAAHLNEFEQARARHIVISYATAFASRSTRTSQEAQAKAEKIASQLKQGAVFDLLAAKESDDPYTKAKGGDLGFVSPHQLEPAVDKVIWSLSPGQSSAPFEGRFGYEIVRVEEKRTQPLDAVREIIIGKIKTAILERKQKEITAGAHITLEPAYADSPLPCQSPRSFNAKDSLQAP